MSLKPGAECRLVRECQLLQLHGPKRAVHGCGLGLWTGQSNHNLLK
ncbi:MAG: hypothetical protein IJ242_02695 [Clostridia bacterium]|nr:hypothetical protein [Clostridia bacterium]